MKTNNNEILPGASTKHPYESPNIVATRDTPLIPKFLISTVTTVRLVNPPINGSDKNKIST